MPQVRICLVFLRWMLSLTARLVFESEVVILCRGFLVAFPVAGVSSFEAEAFVVREWHTTIPLRPLSAGKGLAEKVWPRKVISDQVSLLSWHPPF